MLQKISQIGFTVAFIMFSAVSTVMAAGSGAFRIFAIDSEAAGKGHAFTGEADNPSAVFFNPAGLTQLKGSTHFSIDGSAIQPITSHTSPSGDKAQMQRETFLLPAIFAVSDFGLDHVVFGFGTTSNWGLSSTWNKDSFSAYSATNSELENVDNTLTASYQFNEHFSLGAGVIYDISKFSQEKQINQLPGSDANAQLKGQDEAVGYTLSTLYKFNEHHQVGLIYRSPIELHYKGTATADRLNDAGTLPYMTIFGGASYSTAFEADLKLPQSVAVGYSLTPNDKWRFNVDVEWMDWSSIEREHVDFPDESDPTRLSILDALTASDHDWKSVFSYSFGGEYQWSEKLVLRAGGFYDQSPIPKTTFESSVPASNMYGPSLGAGYQVTSNSTVDLAWSGLFYSDAKIDNTFGNALGANLDGTYKNMVNIVLVTFGHKF